MTKVGRVMIYEASEIEFYCELASLNLWLGTVWGLSGASHFAMKVFKPLY